MRRCIKQNKFLVLAAALIAGVLSPVAYGATFTEDFDDGTLGPYVSVIGVGPIIRDPNQAPWSAGADGELYVDGGNNYNSKADFGVDLGSDFEFGLTMRPYLRNNTQFQMALNTATDGLNPLPAGALRIKIGIQDRIGYDGLAWDIVGGGSGGANFGYAADMVDGGEMRLLVSVSGGNSLTIKKQIIGVDAGLVTVVDGVAISGMSSGHITFTTLESQAQIDDLFLVRETICPPLPASDYTTDFDGGTLGPYVSVIGTGPIIRDPNQVPWSAGADGELYVDAGNNYNSKADFGVDLGGDFEVGLTMRPYWRNNTHFQMLINTVSDDVSDPNANDGALRIKVGIPSRIGYNGLSWEVIGSSSSGGADFDYDTLMPDSGEGEIKLWIIVSGGNTLTIKKQIVGVDNCYETIVDAVAITGLSTTGYITFTTLESQAQIDDLLLVDCVPPVGDFNHDCKVDLADIIIFADSWLWEYGKYSNLTIVDRLKLQPAAELIFEDANGAKNRLSFSDNSSDRLTIFNSDGRRVFSFEEGHDKNILFNLDNWDPGDTCVKWVRYIDAIEQSNPWVLGEDKITSGYDRDFFIGREGLWGCMRVRETDGAVWLGKEYSGPPNRLHPVVISSDGDFTVQTSASEAVLFADVGTKKVGIGTASPGNILTVKQGSATDPIADAWTVYSSRRWKENIEPINGALDKVQRLRGVSYDYKVTGRHDIGLVAEEVAEVIPEVVAYEENGKDAVSVDYSRLVAVLVEAIKERQQKHERKFEQLKDTVDTLLKQFEVKYPSLAEAANVEEKTK